jgi:undecaprenyl diphosphate synthase
MPSSDQQSAVRHLAVIMDGNGRWAKKRMLPRAAGHKKGVDALRALVECCPSRGIEYLTVFAFSSENWRRPGEEVSALMDLFALALAREAANMVRDGVRLRFIGDLSRFSPELRAAMHDAERLTSNNARVHFTIAVNYGGRWDIAQAAARAQAAGVAIDGESSLAPYLSLAFAPDPDLLIRTGGESRISNFLLWQCAYSELYFTETLWPDFDAASLDAALAAFAGRERRFGMTSDQLRRRDSLPRAA